MALLSGCRCGAFVALVLLGTGVGVPAVAAEAPPALALEDRTQASGDWGGLRTWLAEHGIVPYASYTAGLWSNLRGGSRTGARYAGFADWGVEVDLEPLAGWRGGSLLVDWHAYHGGLPSEELVDQFATDYVLGIESARTVRFYNIRLEQRLWDDALIVKAGQLGMDEDFFASRYAGSLVNASYAFSGSGRDQLLAPVFPVAAPGVYAQLRPSDAWELRAGAYTAEPGEDRSGNHGFDWSLDGGASFGAELATSRSPAERPGRYTLGAVGTTKRLHAFSGAGSERGNFGVYFMVDQAVLLDGGGDPTLGVFLRAGFQPLGSRSVVRGYGNAGFTWYAPIPGRNRDTLSAGFAYTDFARDYLRSQRDAGDDVTGHEASLELAYEVQLTGWLVVQPDLQWVFDPHYSRRDALVLALQATIEF